MNVPILHPIVIRDDPRLKARPWSHSAPTIRVRPRPWFGVSFIAALSLIAAAFGVVLWDNIYPMNGATASPDPAHTIAFTQLRNKHRQIFALDSNGRNLRQITAEDANTTQVSWSPDGNRLVFVNDIDGHEQIYRIDTAGTLETRLTIDNMRDVMPSWSPDGSSIAYLGIDGSAASIWIMNSDGSGSRQMTDPSTPDNDISGPLVWSPDSTQLAFASGPPGQTNLMLLNVQSGAVRQLTNLPGRAAAPDWSPDGATLIFTVAQTDSPTNQSVLYTIGVSGANVRQITHGNLSDGQANWSPDGRRITFVRTTSQQSALFVANADGTHLEKLSIAPAGQAFAFPSWSPEGSLILFVRHDLPRTAGGNAALETINADGTDLRTLSTTLAPDAQPVIQPTQ